MSDLTEDRGDEVIEADKDEELEKKDEELEAEGTGDKLSDDGDTETEEEKAEREAAEAEAKKKANIRIPKARFDEAQAKARAREQALLDELEKLKGGQQATSVQKVVSDTRAKIDELQDKYEDAILDGKKDVARSFRKQMEGMREELMDYQTSVKSEAARTGAIEEVSYYAKLASLEASYPALNPDNEAFDEDAVAEVSELLSAFVKAGTKRDVALAKAVKYVMGAPAEEKLSNAGKALAEQRAQQAREKAAAADRKQPPASNKVGLDHDKAGKDNAHGVDVMRMSQDGFAKLDEEIKARLRGDEV